MERSRRPFAIFRRPTKKKGLFVYYCRFRREEGQYFSAVSTGQTSRAAAENWAAAKLREGKIISPGKRGVLFETFAEDFWKIDGEYVTRKLSRGGHFSAPFAKIREGQLSQWILPFFMDRPIGSMSRADIESWQMKLFRSSEISPSMINRVLDNLKVMMKEACRRGFVGADPASGIVRLHEKRKPRGILYPNEIRTLFGSGALLQHWKNERPYYAAAFLATASGARLGEVRGLRVQDVRPEFIAIAGSWEDGYGLKGAKWGSERVVPISTRVASELATVIAESEYQEPMDLVFTGFKRGVPLDKHMIEERFYSAMFPLGACS
jgi:integrase